MELFSRLQDFVANGSRGAGGRGAVMLYYRLKRTDSQLHSTGLESQEGAQANDGKQNQGTSFRLRSGLPRQSNPFQVRSRGGPPLVSPQAGSATTLLFLPVFSGPPRAPLCVGRGCPSRRALFWCGLD